MSHWFTCPSSPRRSRRQPRGVRTLHCEVLETRRLLTITVDTLADGFGPGTSLREAIDLAAAGETIDFAVTGQINLNSLGQLLIAKSLTISGPGTELLTIRAFDPTPGIKNGDGSRVMVIDNGMPTLADVAISGLTLTGGDSNLAGGAILSRENLVITECTISGNATISGGISGGGGIFSGGDATVRNSLTIRDSSITNNTTPFSEGGGIRARYGPVLVQRSTISNNFAATIGGGMSAADGGINVQVIDSTFDTNSALQGGGGIFLASAEALILNSTVSGNHSNGDGGGIDSINGNLTLRHATITNNDVVGTGSDGGGLHFSGIGSAVLDQSIVSGNFDGTICFPPPLGCVRVSGDAVGAVTARFSVLGIVSSGSFTDLGGNVFQSPNLAPLADNGGPTWTHVPNPGSVAINAGDPASIAGMNGVPLFDQRGNLFSRVADGRIDMGAVEVQTLPDGDFNDDGLYDCLDIDSLVAAIAAATHVPSFDLTQDGLVDLADRDAWLMEAGNQNLGVGRAYRLGDANLDGVVDGSDFGLWNANKFTAIAAWCRADFSADSVVDGTDFGIWNSNKFTNSDALVIALPSFSPPMEPGGHRRCQMGVRALARSPLPMWGPLPVTTDRQDE